MKEEKKKEAWFSSNDFSLSAMLLDNREYIYPLLFYISGLFIGAFFYHSDSPLSALIQSHSELNTNSLVTLFINRFALYISVYALTVLFGMCLIGFPFINAIPLVMGISVALKASYYYVSYPLKGIGYALLMLAPEAAAFVTVLIYTIKKSRELSKNIYSITMKKTDIPSNFALSAYLKSFALYVPVIALIAFINAATVYLLGTIVKI